MSQAKQGDKVCIHYRGSLEDGTVFDSTFDKEPFDFTIGEDVVLAGFEEAVLGMTEGEEKTVTLSLDTLAERRTSEVSTMPEGLMATFEEIEILDLLAYLESLGSEPSED